MLLHTYEESFEFNVVTQKLNKISKMSLDINTYIVILEVIVLIYETLN